jgi:hypothetical protein
VLHQKDLGEELEELKMLAIEVAARQPDVEDEKEDGDQIEEDSPIAAQVEKVVELAQDKPEFRNVPVTVLQMIENAPAVRQDDETKKRRGVFA